MLSPSYSQYVFLLGHSRNEWAGQLYQSQIPKQFNTLLNPSTPVAAKTAHYFGDISLTKAIFGKNIEDELFIRTLSTTPLQIFCEFAIFKNMTSPDDTCQVYLQAGAAGMG